MCEYGCGELRPLAKIRGEGGWHFIEVYSCGTSWGLGATWIADGDDMLATGILDEAQTVEYGRHGQWGRALLDTIVLKRLFAEWNNDDDAFSETNFAFSEFVDRGGLIRAQHESLRAPAAEQEEADA